MKGSQYLLEFFKRHGHLMMASSVVTKLMGFAAVVFVTRHTTALDYGSFSYAMNLVGAAVPFMGLGAYQSYLRFAPDSPGQSAKKALFKYAFSRGLAASLCIVALLQFFAFWMCKSVPIITSEFSMLITPSVGMTLQSTQAIRGCHNCELRKSFHFHIPFSWKINGGYLFKTMKSAGLAS